jgi:hypothetical protein
MAVRFSRGFFGSVLLLVGLAALSWTLGGTLLGAQRPDRSRDGTGAGLAQPWEKPVPRAECGKGDRVETGLQGQTTLAERMSGASSKAFNCNLELVGQFQGEGANYQMASFDECAYYGTALRDGVQNKGVVVVDASNPRRPVATAYLDARPMWDPWESLKVNPARKLLAAIQGDNGSGEQPGFAVYDISDCRRPVLKSSVDLGVPVKGHAGHFAPDGRTYYGTHIRVSTYAIAIDNPAEPKLLGVWPGQNGHGLPHDVSLNAAGDRLYTAQPGGLERPGGGPSPNGLVISDVSDFNARRSDPSPKVLSTLFWNDGAVAQMTERVQINGRPYLIFTDEAGAGGIADGAKAACAQRLPPFGFARIIDIADERRPRIVSKLMLEVHDPANCGAVQLDTAFSDLFGYSSHYCTADNAANAQYLACSYFEAGVRVFDIRDPYRAKEIAYYKPPARSATLAGSSNSSLRRHGSRTTDWASSNIRWHRNGDELYLWFTSHENGFQIVKFTNRLASLVKNFEPRDARR